MHPVLQVPRVKRSSTVAFKCKFVCDIRLQFHYVPGLFALLFYCVNLYVCRVTLALRAPSDRLESKEKKEKLYENLKCAHSQV